MKVHKFCGESEYEGISTVVSFLQFVIKAGLSKKRGAQESRNFRQKKCASKKSAVVELVWVAKISEP